MTHANLIQNLIANRSETTKKFHLWVPLYYEPNRREVAEWFTCRECGDQETRAKVQENLADCRGTYLVYQMA